MTKIIIISLSLLLVLQWRKAKKRKHQDRQKINQLTEFSQQQIRAKKDAEFMAENLRNQVNRLTQILEAK